jgi:hypothetical protein
MYICGKQTRSDMLKGFQLVSIKKTIDVPPAVTDAHDDVIILTTSEVI